MSGKEVRVKIVSALGDSNLIFHCDYSDEDKMTLIPAYDILKDLMVDNLRKVYRVKGLEMFPSNKDFYTVVANKGDTGINISVKWGGGIGESEALKLFEDMLNFVLDFDSEKFPYENSNIELLVKSNIGKTKEIAETLRKEVFEEGKYTFLTMYAEPDTFDWK